MNFAKRGTYTLAQNNTVKNSNDQTDPSKPNHYSWTHFKTQILCVNVIGISMIHAGLTIAFTNLLNEHFDEQMVSTFASLSAISTPIGSCVVSFTVDKLGRKYNLLIIQGLCAGTWILASIIDGAVLLNLCAILAGFSRGALTASCPAYISEITHSQYRQLFLSLLSAFFTLGVCIICVLNLILTYKQSGIFLTACFLVLIIFTILLVPESPHWLAVIKMDLNTAKDNLLKLNPLQQVFDKEWSTIEEKIQKSTKILSTKEKLFLLRKSSVYKPTLALLGLIFFQQFCAIYPFTSYTLRTLSKLGNLGKQYESQIFLVSGLLRFIIAVATSVILIKFNQKQLLLVSALGMMCSSAVIIFNREIIVNFIVDNQSSTDWINIISFTVYLITGFIGLLGIPWTIIFELLPTEIKGLLGPLLVGLGYATMSFTMKIFPFVYDAIGTTNVFVYVMIISAMALIYVHYVIIETKGKSLYEIENFYSKKQNEIKISEESDSA